MKEGLPHPRGATWDGSGVNFAVFSAHAERVEVCLFDPAGQVETDRIVLPEYTDQIFHGWVEGLGPSQVYGYRAYGPFEPQNGHRFNPNKLLLDPYARAHTGELVWDPAIFGYVVGHPDADLSFDTRDSAPFVPKSVVVDPDFDWRGNARRNPIPWDRTVIYEAHVRGYTKRRLEVPEGLRGAYAGLGSDGVLRGLSALGVTSLELLPVHSFINDSALLDRGLTNYWGYNSIGFFAPDPRYASDRANSLKEFKEMVARVHEAGLELILDVVYNHTAEGNELGPTLSFKGLDNASYYRLPDGDLRRYINDTGTGNTVNLSHPRVLQMVTDSLRYWAGEMYVDGFRFDLGTILAREPNGFDNRSGFLKACGQDPLLQTVKLIAEPWDCGPGGYQVGEFSPGWAEWNDKFRDGVRDFWRGASNVAALAPRLLASPQEFNHEGRKPWSSVNFITAHDGFTLADLVTYESKHNEANGEDNNDGSSDNRSCNYGAEGPVDDEAINAVRERQIRNMLATLLLSQGTPMILAGDEFGRTQKGNNNAYCQDDEISWVDWDLAETRRDLTAFVAHLTDLRRRFPILRRNRFLTEAYNAALDVKEITWVDPRGEEMTQEDWEGDKQCVGLMLDGRAQPSGVSRRGEDATLLLIVNAWRDLVEFTLPRQGEDGRTWSRLLDTNQPSAPEGGERFDPGRVYSVTARSLLLFVAV